MNVICFGGSYERRRLEVLIALDDPGEDTLEEDTFHQAVNADEHLARSASTRRRPDQ